MSWLDAAVPVRMKRVALVTPDESLRDVLVRVAAAAAVEIGPAGGEAGALDPSPSQTRTAGEAARRLRHPCQSMSKTMSLPAAKAASTGARGVP